MELDFTRGSARLAAGGGSIVAVGGRSRQARIALGLTLAACLRGAGALASEDEVVTLEQALREAAAAKARLPMPALDIQIADEHIKEARAERWLKAAVEGD